MEDTNKETSKSTYLKNCKYTYGVKNHNGETVIRPLNQEEIDFLYKFNNEYYSGNGLTEESGLEESLHRDLIKSSQVEVDNLRYQISNLNQVLNSNNPTKMFNIDKDERYSLHLIKNELESKLEKVNYAGNIYNDMYSRKRDVSNYKKTVNITDIYTSIKPESFGGEDLTEAAMLDLVVSHSLGFDILEIEGSNSGNDTD